jgi:uncharacterized Zn-finger protein
MTPTETIFVETKTVACNGGGSALGHPKVYLNLGPAHRVVCPYCSRLYILEQAEHAPASAASV